MPTLLETVTVKNPALAARLKDWSEYELAVQERARQERAAYTPSLYLTSEERKVA